MDLCPKCGSTHLAIGNFPLECHDCGWSWLNKYPCDVCGEPSVSACGAGLKSYHRCRRHPLTDDEHNQLLRDWLSTITPVTEAFHKLADDGCGGGFIIPAEWTEALMKMRGELDEAGLTGIIHVVKPDYRPLGILESEETAGQ